MNLLDFDTTAFFVRSWRMGLQRSEVSWLTSRDPWQLEGMRWQVFVSARSACAGDGFRHETLWRHRHEKADVVVPTE